MSTLLITHPCFVHHDTGPGHPERPARMKAIDRALADDAFAGLTRAEAPWRDDVEQQILLAHPEAHLEMIKAKGAAANKAIVRLDPDTVMSPGTLEAAMRAVSSGLMAVDAVFQGQHANVFCQVRPPGHHAEANRAMGFCMFSTAAIAGLYARAKHGAERIAVVDFDVHHGNGTQDIFWSDKDLFFGSTHQMPLYPGTGEVSEAGAAGNICNAPLRPNDGGSRFREAFEARILPSLDAFRPDVVIISAGFDAHEADPLGGLRLVEDDFAWATGRVMRIAERHAGGRVVSLLEGGYDLDALGSSVAAHVSTLMNG
jgi:acetoin utilization deacetylase AcuC-like enzyme